MKKSQYVTRERDKYRSVVAVQRQAARMRIAGAAGVAAGKARFAVFAVGAASFAGGVCADPARAESAPVLTAQPQAADEARQPLAAVRLLAAAPVTDFIAVSPDTTAGAPTHVSDDQNAMAIGPTSAATGVNATAVGGGAFAARSMTTAIGAGSAALGLRSTTVGMGASTNFNADNAVAIGYFASADGVETLAFGTYAEAAGSRSVAIGMNAVADPNAANSLALGANSLVSASGGVAIGAMSVANRSNAVSVGNTMLQRQIINLAAGTLDTDAVNVAQLKGVAAGFGGGAAVNGDGTIMLPTYNIDGKVYRNVGDALSNLDGRVTTNTVNIDSLTNVVNNITNANVQLRYFRANSLLADAAATGSEAIAIGGNASAVAGNSVALGANTLADRVNSVSVGSAGNERQITNVAAGTADTDAVNVRQLKDAGLIDGNGNLSSAVTYDNASGQVDYGNITLGEGTAGGTRIHNVADAVVDSDAVNLGQLNNAMSQVINNNMPRASNPFVALNGNADREAAQATGTHAAAVGANASANGEDALAFGSKATATGNTATAVGGNAIANGERTSAFGWGSEASVAGAVALGAGSIADRANAVSVGSAGSERQITNVAPGTRGTDAVNLDQLNAAFNQANQSLHDLDRSTRKGIASAAALQLVTPYLPGRTTLNAGVAAYRGQAALGLGVSRWNEKGTLNFNAGVASSGSNSTIVRAGVGIVIGD